jgi:hypothetical protein
MLVGRRCEMAREIERVRAFEANPKVWEAYKAAVMPKHIEGGPYDYLEAAHKLDLDDPYGVLQRTGGTYNDEFASIVTARARECRALVRVAFVQCFDVEPVLPVAHWRRMTKGSGLLNDWGVALEAVQVDAVLRVARDLPPPPSVTADHVTDSDAAINELRARASLEQYVNDLVFVRI